MNEKADAGDNQCEQNGKLISSVRQFDVQRSGLNPCKHMINNGTLFFRASGQRKEHPYSGYKGLCDCSGTNNGHGTLATEPFAKQPDNKKS